MNLNQELVLPSTRGVDAPPFPGLWTCCWTAIAAVWIANGAHELGHIIPAVLFRAANGDWLRSAWQQLLVSAGGPAITIAVMLFASVLIMAPRIRQHADNRILPLVIGLGTAAATRFFLLAPAALTLFTRQPLPFRPDEWRIGRLVGVPANVLLFAELVAAVICVAYLVWQIPRAWRAPAIRGAVIGVAVGVLTWIGTGLFFNAGMML